MIQTFQTRLIEKNILTSNIYHLKFFIDPSQQLKFAAGQYLILFVPQPDGSYLRRLYSIMSPTTQVDSVDLLAEIIPGGAASEYFKNMEINDPATFQGPAGMFKLKEGDVPSVFVATGTGIAPMISMFYQLLEIQKQTKPVTLFWGLKYNKDIYLLRTLKTLQQTYPHFKFFICLSREETMPENELCFIKGRVNQGLEEQIDTDALTRNNYYICGGREATESLRHYLYNKGIPKGNVMFEKF